MGPDVAVRWEAPAPGEAPSEAARRSLAEWAEARGFHVVDPRDAPLPEVVPDPAVADAVERDLERARDAIAALDTPGAEHALSDADARLEAHPELPAAAWLRAEVLREWGTRWQRLAPRDETRGAAAWARAAGLDGGRSTGVGEIGAASKRPVIAILAFPEGGGDARRATVRLDGVIVRGRSLLGAPGEHQLTFMRDGALVWAGWVTLDDGAAVGIPLPEPAPCSRADLARARLDRDQISAVGVLCSEWVFAREVPPSGGALLLASCGGERCGAPFRWQVGAYGPVLPPERNGVTHWPPWATWTLVGASVVAASAATLAASGVFRPTHDEPVFTTGGLHVSSSPIRLRLGE